MSMRRAEPAVRRAGWPQTPAARATARALLWLCLGGWIGTWLMFGLVVAPTAFSVLPSTQLAGSLVGPVLEALQYSGAAAGLLLAVLAWRLERGALLLALPLAMALACLYSQFGLSPEIAEIRAGAFGPHGSELLAARFNQLHRLSIAIFMAVGVSALFLAALHARADATAEG